MRTALLVVAIVAGIFLAFAVATTVFLGPALLVLYTITH